MSREGLGTVPAILVKMDILAEKVDVMNLNNDTFFTILDTPFEPWNSVFWKMLMKTLKILTLKLTIFGLFH